jgi:hypothetical protein
MKTTITLVVSTFICLQTFAQSEFKHTIGLSGGFTLFGTGDIKGYNFTAKYERQLIKRIAFQSQLSFANAQRFNSVNDWVLVLNPYTISYSQSSSQKLNTGLLVGIYKRKSHFWGINASVGVVKSSQFRYGGYMINPDKNPPVGLEYIPNPPYHGGYLSPGFGAGLEYRYSIAKHFKLGLEAAYQEYHLDTEARINFGVYYSL